jgi:hypothetical protein
MEVTVQRFILRYFGQKGEPKNDLIKDLELILQMDGIRVLDMSADPSSECPIANMLLVEASNGVLDQFEQSFPDWKCIPEKTIPLPDNQPTLNGGTSR